MTTAGQQSCWPHVRARLRGVPAGQARPAGGTTRSRDRARHAPPSAAKRGDPRTLFARKGRERSRPWRSRHAMDMPAPVNAHDQHEITGNAPSAACGPCCPGRPSASWRAPPRLPLTRLRLSATSSDFTRSAASGRSAASDGGASARSQSGSCTPGSVPSEARPRNPEPGKGPHRRRAANRVPAREGRQVPA